MSDDLLGTVKAALDDYHNAVMRNDAASEVGWQLHEAPLLRDWLRALVTRCEQAEAESARLREAARYQELALDIAAKDYGALRQRLAEAVDLLETAVVLAEPCVMTHSTHDCTNCDWHQRADAWLASEARRNLPGRGAVPDTQEGTSAASEDAARAKAPSTGAEAKARLT